MISMLRLQNWGPFEDVTLDLDHPITLFVGANAVGKSWIRESVVLALTGTLRSRAGVTRKNQIPEVAIRDGAKKAEVELLLAGGLRILRQVTASGQTLQLWELDGETEVPLPGTGEELQAELYRRLGMDEGRALAALQSSRFLSLGEDERKALLFAALGAGVTQEVILRVLAARGLEGPDVEHLAKTAAEKGFRKAEQTAVETRRQAKRDLEAVPVVKVQQTVPGREGAPLDLAQVDVGQIEAAVAALEAKRDRLLEEKGASAATAEQTAKALRERKEEIEECLARQVEIDLPAMRVELCDAELELSKAEHQRDGLFARRDDLEAILAVSGTVEKPKLCPAIPGGFECPATAAKLEKHAAALATRRGEAKVDHAKLSTELDQLSGQVVELQARTRSLSSGIRQVEIDEKEIGELRAELETLPAEIAAAEQVAGELRTSGEEAGQAEQAEALRQRIERGRAVLLAKRDYDRDSERAERAAKDRERLTRAVSRADEVAKAFEPAGVEQQLVREALEPIRARLAETGGILGEVTISDDLEIQVKIGGQRRIEPQLSESERMRLGILMQDAIAALPAFPVLLVDQCDTFVQETRAAVLGLLDRLRDDPYGSILVFASTAQQIPTRPPSPHVGMVWIHDGKAEAIR